MATRALPYDPADDASADPGTRPRGPAAASRRKRRSPRPRCARRPAATASSRASSRRSTPTSRCGPGGTWPRSSRAARDVGPLLGPHADRPQHRPAAAAAAGQGGGRAGDRRRPRDARPRRRGRRRRRRPAARRRHVDPPRRPRGLQPLPRQRRPASGCSPTPTSEPERTVVASEILHAIIGHRRRGEPYTLEAGVVRVADALDMAQGRTRIPIEAGHEGIHSISAAAIDEVRIEAGEERPVRIEIELNNSAGIFQVDDLLATKIRGTPLEGQVEVVAEDRGRDRETPAERVPAQLKPAQPSVRGRCGAVPCASPACPGSATARSAGSTKKAITPKQKKVTVLSVVGPARPTPFSASAAGASDEHRGQDREQGCGGALHGRESSARRRRRAARRDLLTS